MPDARTADKSPDAFRTISEVAEELGLPQHVLRFWETKFTQIRPVKRAGGRRFYRPDDIVLLRGIQHLLYGEGYTIKGVQKILKDNGVRHVQGIGVEADGAPIHSSEPEESAPRKPRGGMVGGLLGLIPGRKAPPPQPDYDPLEEPPLPFMDEGFRAAPRVEPGLDAPRARDDYPVSRAAGPPPFPEGDGEDDDYRAHEAYETPHPRAGGAGGHMASRAAAARQEQARHETLRQPPSRVEPRFEPDPPEQFHFSAPPDDAGYGQPPLPEADEGFGYEEPAFTPLPPAPAAPPVREANAGPQRRPSRGPAARTPEPPPVPELEDPLLPFFDDAPLEPPAQQISEPLEARIRRMKEREEPAFMSQPVPPQPVSHGTDIPSREPRTGEHWSGTEPPRAPHRGPLRAPPEEVFAEDETDFEAREAFAPDGTRVPRPEPRHGPPEQYLPPHLRSDPRLTTPGAVPVLSREDVARLQGALHELGECRRLLDQVLDPEPGRRS
ncbi:MerR family transcriptional regulator [Aquabacter sp. L1I39]|nr:MerR family transcriptional regulator [Aquabacter sp. L1I39]